MTSPIEEKLARVLEPMLDAINWKLARQVRFGKYTADFAVVVDDDSTKAIIECDGHTYHDRTDEQATHDRRRDRWFLRNGIVTIRFSSSEIFANAEACATELIRTIAALRNRNLDIAFNGWIGGVAEERCRFANALGEVAVKQYGSEGLSPLQCPTGESDRSCVGGSGDNRCGSYLGDRKVGELILVRCGELAK